MYNMICFLCARITTLRGRCPLCKGTGLISISYVNVAWLVAGIVVVTFFIKIITSLLHH